MSAPDGGSGYPGWRFADRSDLPFLYHLATALDPRWWHVSRRGLHPERIVECIGSFAAGVVVFDGERPCGFAGLRGQQGSDVATIDLQALPDPASVDIMRRVVGELIAAAFMASPVRRLLYERFDDDVDLLGSTADLWDLEVTLPEFARVDGRYADRLTLATTRGRFESASDGLVFS
jgi:hypothetical protein